MIVLAHCLGFGLEARYGVPAKSENTENSRHCREINRYLLKSSMQEGIGLVNLGRNGIGRVFCAVHA